MTTTPVAPRVVAPTPFRALGAERGKSPLPGGAALVTPEALPDTTRSVAPAALTALDALSGARSFARVTGGAGPSAPSRAPAAATVVGGSTLLKTRAAFEAFAKRDDVPGAASVLAVKFLVTGVDTGSPQVWLVDGNQYAYHFDFATRGLGKRVSLEQFNSETYFKDARKNVAGTIVAHDSFVKGTKKGMYALEFWPTDPVKADKLAKAYKLLAKALPFTRGKLAYHPAGDTQEALFKEEAAKLKSKRVPTISTDELFHGVTWSPLNPGVGFGVLKVVDGNTPQGAPLTARDVVIFKGATPNDLSHVGGIITEAPQTPLSHINLKAQQNKTPNAYVKDITQDPAVASLVGKVVRYEVGPNGWTLKAATQQEADTWLETQRPTTPQTAARDLSKKKVLAMKDIGAKDAKAFGAKTANLAEMRKFLPGDMVPDGFGIPFSFYDDFMKKSGLYDEAKKMMAEPRFQSDAAYREEQLKDFRKKVKKAPIPPALEAQLADLQKKFPAGQPIRCRSSTNNEDLEGFNGAGLYDSHTHRPEEGALSNTVKQVWAGLWTFRAFEERDFWRIDHLTAAMGVTVHANTDDEKANGVAITKNIYDPNWPGFYVNAQLGESLVTNPTGAVPDELLVSAIGPNMEYEVQRIRKSSENGGQPVLSDAQLQELVRAMEKIQEHFKRVYGRQNDKSFAMDLEWKITAAGKLWIKQARPVVS